MNHKSKTIGAWWAGGNTQLQVYAKLMLVLPIAEQVLFTGLNAYIATSSLELDAKVKSLIYEILSLGH